MSLWTLQNTEVTGETQWTNANYNGEIVIPDGGTVPTQFLQVAGYTSGTISFTIDAIPAGWGPPPATLQISILGGIQNTTPTTIPPVPVSIFTAQTLELYNGSGGDSNLRTFYIEWNIPIEFVALSIFNNTGGQRTLTNIRLLTESQGGGIGFTSSSGATVGPSTPVYSLQFNNTGVFGGASGALYDTTGVGQVQLAAGSESAPMLAFSDGTHPLGNYDTGIYRVQADTLGIATRGVQQVTITTSASPAVLPTGMIRGLNVGTNALPPGTDRQGIQRLSANSRIGWQDGHLGHSERIYFTSTDVMPGTAGPRTLVTWQQQGFSRPPIVYSNSITSPIPNTVWCISKVVPTGFLLGKAMCIVTQDTANPKTISNLSVVWYSMSGTGWSSAAINDVTPLAPWETDTNLVMQNIGNDISGTGGAQPQFIVSIQFQSPALAAIAYPEGIVGGWIEIRR